MDLNSSSLHFESPREDIIIYEEESSFALTDESFVTVSEPFGGDYVDGEYHERNTILVDGGEHFGVSAVAFDTHEELLWMGNQGGHVTSYYGPDMQKYTSFQVHATDEVRCIHTVEGGIMALTPSALRYQLRRGIPIFTHCSDNMVEMQCMLELNHSPDTLLLGGHTTKLIEFNFHQGQELNMIDVGEGGCAILRQHSRFVCCGDPSGQITLRDPLSLRIEHALETHTGSLSDFDVHGHLLVSCGFSNRGGALAVDNFLLVYDIRMMRAVAPIPIPLDPFLLRFMPTFSSRLTVTSPVGQLQFVETVTLSEPDLTIYQVHNDGTSLASSLDVSSSSQAVCLGDLGGSLHVLTSTATPVFNAYSRPTEFPDPIEPYQSVSMDDSMAIYASFPLPLTSSSLLSDWPEEFTKKCYRRTPPIDSEVLRTIKMQGTIGYAPNPNNKRRNQVPVEYFLGSRGRNEGRIKEDGGSGFVAIPKRYRKPDSKHSTKLFEDLELDHFNKTGFSGLEATLPNSYCNSMIQVLFFTDPVRAAILSHSCRSEFCVCCELGFLFYMLSSSSGSPCHSGNLLRALRSAKEASALHLILSDSSSAIQEANYVLLIQSWNRFILHQLHSELLDAKRKGKEVKPPFVYRDTDFPIIDLQSQRKKSKSKTEFTVEDLVEDSSKGESEITKLFGSKQTLIFTCRKCNNKGSKEATQLVHHLIYPNSKGESKEVSFCEVVKGSLGGSQVTPAWCDQCHKFQPTLQERKVKSLPQLLSFNCGNYNESDKKFWKEQIDAVVLRVVAGSGDMRTPGKQCRYGSACTRPGCRFKHPQKNSENAPLAPLHLYYSHSWVPSHMRVSLSIDGDLTVNKIEASQVEIEAQEVQLGPDIAQSVVYDLYSVVCYVHDEKKNVVSIINVGPMHHTRVMGNEVSQWYIFNDFSITPVSGQEAVWFSIDWKIPCVLYWQEHQSRLNGCHTLIPRPISPNVFVDPAKCNAISPLLPHEIPQPGDLVAMDAEFVTLNQEESELRSDGKLATIKPSQMSVARISCVRGDGPLEGTTFIDDYISTQEQVFDYLTKFSGIKPGDLDATCSSKHLTTLKSTYLKLRYLIDNGIKFVGHGLKNDFRVINLVVPPEQVIDTVHLFHLPHHRMVSLRFLAWHFLGMKIQSETHDSIEDARAALHLYKKYLELKSEGILKTNLEQMYLVGKSLQWKVPGLDENS